MLRKLRESLEKREEGFTLIELLVVVIIIGILAAIAIPVFLNQREKAWTSAVKSDLRNAAVAQETYYTDNNTYTSTVADLEDNGFNNGANVDFDVTTATATEYCMLAFYDADGDDAPDGSTSTWYFSSADGEPSETAC